MSASQEPLDQLGFAAVLEKEIETLQEELKQAQLEADNKAREVFHLQQRLYEEEVRSDRLKNIIESLERSNKRKKASCGPSKKKTKL